MSAYSSEALMSPAVYTPGSILPANLVGSAGLVLTMNLEDIFKEDPKALKAYHDHVDLARRRALIVGFKGGTLAGRRDFDTYIIGLQACKRLEEKALANLMEILNKAMVTSHSAVVTSTGIIQANDFAEFIEGRRPSALTQDFIAILLRKANKKPFDLSDISVEELATILFLDNWDNIDGISDEESQEVITYIGSHAFGRNPGLGENVLYYKSLGMLPPDFPEDTVRGGVSNNGPTRRALIGIYFRKLPVETHNCVFVPKKKIDRDESPFLSKQEY